MNKLSLQLNARCDCVLILRSMVNVLCERAKLTVIEKNRVNLAVDELYANIVRHAYQGEAKPLIFDADIIACDKGDMRLQFMFRDYAAVVDTSTWDCNDVKPCCAESMLPGGLGMPLIHTIMDTVTHAALDDGNRWILQYRLQNAGKGEKYDT